MVNLIFVSPVTASEMKILYIIKPQELFKLYLKSKWYIMVLDSETCRDYKTEQISWLGKRARTLSHSDGRISHDFQTTGSAS